MAKDDCYDKLGKLLDPLGSYDYNGDGVHDMWETMDAEIEEDRLMQEADEERKKKRTASYDDLDDEMDDDACDDEYFDEEEDDDEIDASLRSTARTKETVTESSIQITFSIATDEEELSEREEQIKDAEYYIKKYSGSKKPSEFEQDILRRAQFILKHDCIASRYCNILNGFNLTKALVDGVFRLPDEYIENFDIDDNIYVNLAHIKKYKPSLAMEFLKWFYKEFFPYRDLDKKLSLSITSEIISYDAIDDEELEDEIYDCTCKEYKMIADIIANSDELSWNHNCDVMFKALIRGDDFLVVEFASAVINNSLLKPMVRVGQFESLANAYCLYTFSFTGRSIKRNVIASRGFLRLISPMLERLKNPVTERPINKISKKLEDFVEAHKDEV